LFGFIIRSTKQGRNRLDKAKPFDISKRIVFNAWKKVKANQGSAGVDDVGIMKFEDELSDNLYKLWNRLSSGSYFPPPVKEVEIPKGDGGVRKLGVPTVSDRVAQMAVKLCFEPILEPCFHTDSYAYRPNKSAIQALGVTRKRCWRYNWVLEFDIRKAFDNIDHRLMMKAVRHHTNDPWIILYVERWLKAPVQLVSGTIESRDKGTPQGGVISPLLFNLYLHYVFDTWMQRHHPANPFVRYADDGIVHCNSEHEANAMMHSLEMRLLACKLEIHPMKTRIIYCRDANRKGQYPNTWFDFLGYTFRGRLAKSREGKYFNSFSPAISKVSAKRLRSVMRSWNISRWTNATLEMIASRVNRAITGWCGYYGHFCPSLLKDVLTHFNKILLKWVVRKFKRFRYQPKRARNWLANVASREPILFSHWHYGVIPAAEQ